MPGRFDPKPLLKWSSGVAAALFVALHRAFGAALLADTDTAVLLSEIARRASPLSWFVGDWPLGNRFYRPIPTLLFEADRALYGMSPAGYGWTNALLAAAGVLALLFFAAQIVPPLPAIAASWFYAMWLTDGLAPVAAILPAFASILLLFGTLRRSFRTALLAAVSIWAFSGEIVGIESLSFRTIGWLPGRTATTAAIFVLLALGCYARSLLGSPERGRDPDPLAPPATSSTSRGAIIRSGPWFVASLAFTVLALASYEQAVMLPALVFGVALLLAPSREVRFGPHLAHWGILGAYLVFRAAIIPVAASGYQRQQFRAGPGVAQSLLDYVSPNLRALTTIQGPLSIGPAAVVVETFWRDLALLIGFVALWLLMVPGERRRLAIFAGMSFFAFLPMAFLKPFEHYHALPMALRSLFVVGAIGALAGASRRATSPRPIQAPARSRPAPGSLPHL